MADSNKNSVSKGVEVPEFNQYKNKKLQRNVKDNNLKDDVYYRVNPQALYSLYLSNGTTIPWSHRGYLNRLKAYGQGLQDENKYKTFLDNNDLLSTNNSQQTSLDNISGQKALRKGWNNILWEIVSFMPKIRTMIQGMADDVEYDIYADCVDFKSEDKKAANKWRTWVDAQNFEWQAEFKTKAGIPIDEPSYMPSSLEELNQYEAAGNFRLNESRVVEKLLKHTFQISKWDEFLKEKIVDDLIDYNVAVIKDYYDTTDCKFKEKYIDPRNWIMQYSDTFEYDDSEYAGHFQEWTIANLRGKGFSEEELKVIAQTYCGYLGNPTSDKWDAMNKLNRSGYWEYDDFKICCLEAEWIDIEGKKTVLYTNRFGGQSSHDLDYDIDNIKDRDSRRLIKKGQVKDTHIKKLYKSTWIVGTDHIFDYGEANFQDRPNKSRVSLSYKAVQLPGKALTATLVPLLDELALSWYKFQNAKAKAFNAGYAINTAMLENVMNGQNEMSPIELVKFFGENQIMLYKYSVEGSYQGGAGSPITPIPSTFGEELNTHMANINHTMSMIEMLTGLNPVSLGSSPQPGQAVGTTEASLTAASNSLKPLFRGLFRIKSRVAESNARRVSLGIKSVKEIEKAYTNVIGESDVKLIKEAVVNDVVYAFDFVERPDVEQKQRLLGYIQAAMDLGRNGVQGGIEMDTAMMIEEMLMKGNNLSDIRFQIGYQIKKYNERLQQNADRNQQIVQEGNQNLEAQKNQNELIKIQEEAKAEMLKDNNQSQNNIKEINAKAIADANANFMESLNEEPQPNV